MGGGRRHQTLSRGQSVEQLYTQKHTFMSNIERIRRSIKEKTIALNPTAIQCRLQILEQYISQAMTYQTEIYIIDPSNNERSELEDLCVSTKCLLIDLLPSNGNVSFVDTTLGPQKHVNKLPAMKLPKFSGKYSDYKNFMSLFESLVDNDLSMTNIEKFNHLLSCLADEALGTVKAYQVTDDNYPKAIMSLKKVYDNPCLIFFDNISSLFDLPEMLKPSSSALRNLIDTVSAIYNSLLSIGDDKHTTSALIIHLVMMKVDAITRSKWEEQLDYDKLPLWSDCETALNRRYQHISAEESSSTKLKINKSILNDSKLKNKSKSFSCQTKQQGSSKCIFCRSGQHYVSACPTFAAINIQQRFDFIKNVPACINCLKKGHTVSKCKLSKCRICNRSHHTLLHQYSTSNHDLNVTLKPDPNQPSTSRAFVNHSSSAEDNVILATAVVEIKNKYGQYVLARALLDSGSQVNFITEELAQHLQLRKDHQGLNLVGIGKTSSSVKYKLQGTVKSRINEHEFSTEFWVLKSISTYQPDQVISTSGWDIPNNLKLADPLFNKPQKIDLLIGAEVFFELLCIGQIKKSSSLPTLQKTLLGWIVSGKYHPLNNKLKSSCHVANIRNEKSLDEFVRKFWELEEIPNDKDILSIEQQQCEENFVKSVRRLTSGRFTVSLPFKRSPQLLGSSFEAAKRRFTALERRFSKDLEMKELYNTFMKEYLLLGHMSITDNKIPNYPHYFIPHQCVLRPQSSSTKLRVVFDASCKTSTQLSLNDLLMIGPTIEEELYSILIRFRTHKYALTADIEKMYRQVEIDEADRNFQIGDLYKYKYPIGSKVIRKDFYVDDLLTGADSIEELEVIRTEVTDILQSAGFHLTKFFSNYKYSDIQKKKKTMQINDSDSTKALGTYWLPKEDIFTYNFQESFDELKATKRNILSVSSRLFDPLGLLYPLVIKAKILLQELWLQKLDWDESIPQQLYSSWEDFKQNLSKIDVIKIPRYVGMCKTASCEVHGFSDTSGRAYGCCIYVRSQTPSQTIVRLLTAKSRVAPLKVISLPRLELCAAQLLAKLWSKVKGTLNYSIENVIFWTDSEIVLHWIQAHPSTLKTFVANRVSDIQDLSDQVTWRHVPTKQNPADIVSRGCNVNELATSIWFEGPSFLREKCDQWPINNHFNLSKEQELLEKVKTTNSLLVIDNEAQENDSFLKVINKHSSYLKVIRIFAYVFRFVDVCKANKQNRGMPLTAEEVKLSFYHIIQIIQAREYTKEIGKLKKGVSLPPNLQRLNPFIHVLKHETRTISLIRVGGRLANAPISYDAKFPLLIPHKSHFTTLYLCHLHYTNCHAGVKALIALLRQYIWLINAKEACTKIVRNCVHCFHYKPKLMSQIMGNLPADRIRAIRPFKICGVDFCGPVNVTLKIRGRPPTKMYIAVFVCFTSKGVHLELVSDLTSNCFILCLKRFVARRGHPDKIYSDNATNFVGAARELREFATAFHQEAPNVASYAASKGIEFTCIPPRAPHFGGLWEAAVKSAKGLLFRTVKNALLTPEELHTMLVEVEAVLNSRPLAPLSSDPNDGEALTPAHLLIGESLRALHQGLHKGEPGKLTYLKRWQMLCGLKQRFWQSWAKDYVRSLQTRNKWSVEEPDLDVGKLVLIQEENLPPLQWMTGRVQAVMPGKDHKIRVVEIKTTKGVYKRPIHKLALLPCD